MLKDLDSVARQLANFVSELSAPIECRERLVGLLKHYVRAAQRSCPTDGIQ